MSETSLTAARKWLDTAAEAHGLGEWSRSAAAARLGLGYAHLAAAEIAATDMDPRREGRLEAMGPRPIPTLDERAVKLSKLGVINQ
jgi:hypothetical protein